MSWIITVSVWLIPTLIISIISFIAAFRLYNVASVKECTSDIRLDGKTIIVTGASSGIGKEAAMDFARRGAKVILACRNWSKAEKVADYIRNATDNKNVHVRLLDTSLMSSVRDFACDILHNEQRLDVLCLNAGIGGSLTKQLTKEGLETTMASNHFGHFLLLNLLSDMLRRSRPSRVVITSGQVHMTLSNLNPKDLNFKREKYGGFKAYSLSKLCNLMMTKYIAVYFSGKGVAVNCFCPGVVMTEMYEKSSQFSRGGFLGVFLPLVGRAPVDGAQTLIHLAVSEEVSNVSGGFFIDCKEKRVSSLAENAGLIKKMWEASEEVVQLTPEERNRRAKPTT